MPFHSIVDADLEAAKAYRRFAFGVAECNWSLSTLWHSLSPRAQQGWRDIAAGRRPWPEVAS